MVVNVGRKSGNIVACISRKTRRIGNEKKKKSPAAASSIRGPTGIAFASNVEIHLGLVGKGLVELVHEIEEISRHILLAVRGPAARHQKK